LDDTLYYTTTPTQMLRLQESLGPIANIGSIWSSLVTIGQHSAKGKSAQDNLEILDPITTIFRLALLGGAPLNTKISVTNNSLHADRPTLTQPMVRWMRGASRTNINNVCNPIKVFLEWSAEDEKFIPKKVLAFLKERAVNGIERLKKTYNNEDLLHHSLNYYIGLFTKPEPAAPNPLYAHFRALWTERELRVLCDMVHLADKDPAYLQAVRVVLDSKDKAVHGIVTRVAAGKGVAPSSSTSSSSTSSTLSHRSKPPREDEKHK
jgi:hypothetical protein